MCSSIGRSGAGAKLDSRWVAGIPIGAAYPSISIPYFPFIRNVDNMRAVVRAQQVAASAFN